MLSSENDEIAKLKQGKVEIEAAMSELKQFCQTLVKVW